MRDLSVARGCVYSLLYCLTQKEIKMEVFVLYGLGVVAVVCFLCLVGMISKDLK